MGPLKGENIAVGELSPSLLMLPGKTRFTDNTKPGLAFTDHFLPYWDDANMFTIAF